MVCIRQPGYLPYMGFFKKIQSCDTFVYFDDAQYVIRAWDNRNKIRNKDETIWITVPVIKPYKLKLNQVLILQNNWQQKHLMAIKTSYEQCLYFDNYWKEFSFIYKKNWENIVDLNIELIEFFKEQLDINTQTIKSSELNTDGTGSKKLLNICKKLQATAYLSGELGREYLDEKIFEENNIDVVYEHFIHPIYNQNSDTFIPNLSILDLLFNEGANSKNIIQKSQNLP